MGNKLKQGEALFAEGKIEEAEKCFLEILKGDTKNADAYNNLGVIALRRQNGEQGVNYFTKALEIDPFHKDAILNYSVLLKSTNRFYDSAPILEKAIERFPDDQEISRLLSEVRQMRRHGTKIAVLCLPGLQSFLGDIVDYLKTKYDVRTCYSNNNQEIESAVQWADIVWLEWANELTIALTNHPTLLNGKHAICRLHSYEAFTGSAGKINWGKISDLIFVAEHIKNIVLQQIPDLLDKVKNIHIVPNGVNLDKFPFKRRRTSGKNLAYVGHINYKKGPMLLLHAFRELVQKDSRYRLFIAGNFQDARYELYFNQMIKEMNLANNIQMDGWVEDVARWLEDKQYIVCSSVLESQNMAIMEAMARGLKPVIHNFVGAKGIYPEKYLWNTIPEFVRMVTKRGYNSAEYRKYIKDNYSIVRQLREIERLFESIGKTRESVPEADVQKNHQIMYKSGDQEQTTASKPAKKLNKMLSKHDDHIFDYSKCWNNRLRKDFSITGIGHIDYSVELKKALYANRLYLLDCLTGAGISQCKSVLEIGPGTGIFTNYSSGHESVKDYLGVDIAKVSVEQLTKKFGERFKFQQGDFASTDILEFIGEKRFDVAFAADVLLHIMSDGGLWQFITNVSRFLKDGGIYIGMEPISFLAKEETDNINTSPHNRMFRWEELNQCLKKNGLTVEFLTPLSFIMNTPFDAARVSEIKANTLNRLVIESTKGAEKNQELMDTIRFIDKNLISEYQTALSEWMVVCRKDGDKGESLSPKSFTYKPLMEQLCTSVKKREAVPDVDQLMRHFETVGYDPVKLIDHFIPYKRKHVDKFLSSEPIEPVTIKAEEISNGTFHIEMLLRNSHGGQLFVGNLLYVPLPQRTFHSNAVFEPLKSYLLNLVSKLELVTGSHDRMKNYVFDEKLKKDIRENELAYMWERAYPGTQFMHFRGLAVIVRRYRFAGRYIEGKDILEAASGFGYGAASFSRQAKSIIALDIAEENIEFGKRTYGFDNISWQQGDVIELPLKSSSFDVYVSFETIEHLKHETIPVYLSEASRILRTDGIFIVSTPNRKTREGRINNPYHLSEMYYEQLKEYLEKSFNKVHYYSTKSLAIYWGAYPSWADGFIAICENK